MWRRVDANKQWDGDRAVGGGERSGWRSRESLIRAVVCVLEPLEQRVFLSGNGLAVTYWNNASPTYSNSLNFSGSSVSRIDPTVNFDWGSASPSGAIQPDTFSARWTGQIAIPATATYTFYARSDDGVKLWVNEVLVINNWRNQSATERSGSITLTGGQRYDIRMEYYDNLGSAVAQLRWSSPTIAKAIVPQSVLYSTALPAAPAVLTPLPATAAGNVPKITLAWTASSADQNGYVVERSADGINFTAIATVAAGTTSYGDAGGLAAGTSYTYRLRSAGSGGVVSVTAAAKTAGFHVYDGMLFTGEPDPSSSGMERLYITYNNNDGIWGSSGTQPNEAATRALADKVWGLHQVLCFDCESLSLDLRFTSAAEVQANMTTLAQFVDWAHSERPQLKVGFYGIMPLSDYWAPTYFATQDPAKLQAWKDANAFLSPLAQKVDVIFPSLYTSYDDQAAWQVYAQANIEQARQYGKPVVPFLSMYYPSGLSALGGQSLPADYWQMQQNLVRQNADGLVIWGGWAVAWDANAPWWQATQAFLAS